MAFTIHEQATKKQMFLNVSRPQEQVPDPLPENWTGTLGQGLPVKQIPHFEFPCILYMHPNRPTKTVVHRNTQHEIVHEEEIPLEHLTRVISCEAHKNGGPKDCANCNKALESALGEGWTRTPYIAPEIPKPDDDLYGRPRGKK